MRNSTSGHAMREVAIIEADLLREDHRLAVETLIDAYARDPMGQGRPLDPDVRTSVVDGLRTHPTTVVLLAYVGEEALGIAVCFLGYSTFAARPLLNLHDLSVLPAFRGRGIGRALLAGVEQAARARGCCKVTLEVYESNVRARRTYEAAGFGSVAPGATKDCTLFMTKPL